MDRSGNFRRVAAAALCLLCAGVAHAQRKPSPSVSQRVVAAGEHRPDVAAFAARVESLLTKPGAAKGHWGVLVVDAETGEQLYARNSERFFLPASNAKLFTTALALATLGPDYRFRTTLETRGTLDSYGRLRGDLVLVGRGDPNLSNRKFPFVKKEEREGPPEKVLAELVDGLAARGVQQIEGDIVADESFFKAERYPSGWEIDDMLWSYGAAISALAVNDNVIILELRPGAREGDPLWFGVEPSAGYYTIQNEARTGAKGSERKLEVRREPGSKLIYVGGTMPLDAQPHKLEIAVEDPAEHAAVLLKRLLEARGVRVYGEPRARQTPDPGPSAATVLAEHISLPLIEDVRLTNKISQNLHAELLLRVAAREKAGATDLEAALVFAQDFFLRAGIPEGDVILSDGSGLSRRDLVTPQAVVSLLAYVARQPWAEAFRSTLPVPGEDGTLADRMKNTAASGHVWAKTGSVEHANALSGYATTLRGEKLLFALFGNQHALKNHDGTAVLDAICVAMVEELGSPARRKEKKP